MATGSKALSYRHKGELRAPTIVVVNPRMGELLRHAERVARSDAKVLITGESGTGKDVIARHVHCNSARRSREFVAVNCAGVAESLLESELFGHLKGSFTGAYRDQPGKLQLAHGGTLFLDEVGEMSLKMQALLLRFLENGEIQPVGADLTTTSVDVRVITATNRNLSELVGSGQFREDLLYRLRVVHLHVPPLRERPEDVKELADHFMRRLGREVELTEDAWKALQRHRWPDSPICRRRSSRRPRSCCCRRKNGVVRWLTNCTSRSSTAITITGNTSIHYF